MSQRRFSTRLHKAHEAGFTLIEVLVVLAIILSLAGMLLPHLKAAKEKSRRATCMNNLRNLGQAVTMYANDFQDRVPIGPPDGSAASAVIYDGGSTNATSHGLLYRDGYLPNLKTFFCPSANFYNFEGGQGAASWGSGTVTSSYLWRNNSAGGDQLTTLSELASHSALAVDYNQFAFLDQFNHEGKYANILFGDGHVRAVADPNGDSCSTGNADLIFTWADSQN